MEYQWIPSSSKCPIFKKFKVSLKTGKKLQWRTGGKKHSFFLPDWFKVQVSGISYTSPSLPVMVNLLETKVHPHAACELPTSPETGEGGGTPIGGQDRGMGDKRSVLRRVEKGTGTAPSSTLWHMCHWFANTELYPMKQDTPLGSRAAQDTRLHHALRWAAKGPSPGPLSGSRMTRSFRESTHSARRDG